MKTVFHAYRFDTRKPEEARACDELFASLKAQGLRVHKSYSPGSKSHYLLELHGKVLELQTEHIFDNQWNTAPVSGVSDMGYRVFDCAQDVMEHSTWLVQGHYLEQTEEMREIRRNTVACGFCEHQEPISVGNTFCPGCMGSPYLKEPDLYLTRLLPVSLGRGLRSTSFTEPELARVLTIWKEAQLHRTAQVRAKERAKVLEKYEEGTRQATTERDGMLWLLDRGMSIEDVIYYSHSNTFCFGWRWQGLDPSLVQELKYALAGFPFKYEIHSGGVKS